MSPRQSPHSPLLLKAEVLLGENGLFSNDDIKIKKPTQPKKQRAADRLADRPSQRVKASRLRSFFAFVFLRILDDFSHDIPRYVLVAVKSLCVEPLALRH